MVNQGMDEAQCESVLPVTTYNTSNNSAISTGQNDMRFAALKRRCVKDWLGTGSGYLLSGLRRWQWPLPSG